jgi:hypothetical protein
MADTSKKALRGPNFHLAEDPQVCYAWIATSEDSVVGTNLKSSDFKEKFHRRYVLLIEKYNQQMKTCYGPRNASGCFNRFRKLSRGLLKLLGTENSIGSPPSGDSEREQWDSKVKELFLKRHPDYVKMVDSITFSKDILGDKPKWRAYQDEEEREGEQDKKKARPIGNKKSKQVKEDKNLVEKFLSGESLSSGGKPTHKEKKEKFMHEMGEAMSMVATALTTSMNAQNDIKLLEMLSPASKKEMAKKMLMKRMADSNQAPAPSSPAPSSITVSQKRKAPSSNWSTSSSEV